MNLFYVFFCLGAVRIGIFSKYSQRSLVLSGRNLLVLDVGFLQQLVHVGKLKDDTDRPKHCKGRRYDFVCDRRHHITARGCHLVHTYSQCNAGLTDTIKLTGCKPITDNGPTG